MRLSYKNVSETGTRFAKGDNPKHVFVFGAGLSIPAGAPSAAHLLRRASLWNVENSIDLNTNLVDSFCDYFYPNLARLKGEFPDAEDMLGLMDAAEEYDGIRGRGRGYKWRAGYLLDARRQLIRLISEYLWSFQNEETLRRIQFIRNIARKNPTRTVFVTFNYDLLLETALTQEGIDFSYALDRNNPTRNVVLKPHGSINWFEPADHPKASQWQTDNCTELLRHVWVFTEGLPTFLSAGINPSYVLVAPTPHKQIDLEFLKRQWTSFSSAIHSCPKITVVGYSLPAADKLARIVLRRGGSPHNTTRRITVIDQNADLEKHYKETVSSRIDFINDFCENYFS
ncbi:MAG TPA: SIR2 family protein [Pseudolabrys sp.]|nr:SIR2 family protein [Pseudolabrys sp.]